MKITVLMPTFNDEKTICETLDSLRIQTFINWELHIMDDGSTDNTAEVIQRYIDQYKERRIVYHFQENQDQLTAIKNLLPYVDGEYIYILHSDDILVDQNSFQDFINYQKKHPGYDAYYGDVIFINESGVKTGERRIAQHTNKECEAIQMYLWLGRNTYIDVAYFRRDIYVKKIKETYLTWNMPYWLDITASEMCLNIKKFDFPMFCYRVFDENYINNDLGKLNVINGELRTLTTLMQYYNIPFYGIQYFLYRCFCKLKMNRIYKPVCFKKPEKKKGRIIEFVIAKRFGKTISDNLFLTSLIAYYSIQRQRTIIIKKIPSETPIYLGCDMRIFNKKLMTNQLEDFYINFMKEMRSGFDAIICNKTDLQAVETICKFMCINPKIISENK